MLEAFVGILAGQAKRAKIDQRQMGIGAAGDEVRTALLEPIGERLAFAMTALA